VQYCSKKCQAAATQPDWPTHKERCRDRLDKNVAKAKKQHGREDEAVAKARMDAGDAHMVEGRFGEAERLFLEARCILTAAHGGDGPRTARACMQLGQVYEVMGRYEDALKVLKECLRICRRDKINEDVLLAILLSKSGLIHKHIVKHILIQYCSRQVPQIDGQARGGV